MENALSTCTTCRQRPDLILFRGQKKAPSQRNIRTSICLKQRKPWRSIFHTRKGNHHRRSPNIREFRLFVLNIRNIELENKNNQYHSEYRKWTNVMNEHKMKLKYKTNASKTTEEASGTVWIIKTACEISRATQFKLENLKFFWKLQNEWNYTSGSLSNS